MTVSEYAGISQANVFPAIQSLFTGWTISRWAKVLTAAGSPSNTVRVPCVWSKSNPERLTCAGTEFVDVFTNLRMRSPLRESRTQEPVRLGMLWLASAAEGAMVVGR